MSEEMKLTPEVEDEIRQAAAQWGFSVERVRYYYRFGVDAPDWSQPSRKA